MKREERALRAEDAFDRQNGLGLDQIVRLDRDTEVMFAAHAFMHDKGNAKCAGLTGL